MTEHLCPVCSRDVDDDDYCIVCGEYYVPEHLCPVCSGNVDDDDYCKACDGYTPRGTSRVKPRAIKQKEEKDIELVRAAGCGDLVAVKKLVDSGADITSWNNGAIRSAAIDGHLEVVRYLISIGADYVGQQILRVAAWNGHLDVVEYLVSIGVDIKEDNNAAVMAAAMRGHLEVLKYLVSLGGEITTKSLAEYLVSIGVVTDSEWVARLAAWPGQSEVIKFMMASGVNCDGVPGLLSL